VGEGEGAGESVCEKDCALEELSDGDGVGAGDKDGKADGVVGTGEVVGTPRVGFRVGDLERVGVTDGEGDGRGE